MRKFTSFLLTALAFAGYAGGAAAQYVLPTASTDESKTYYTINSYNRGGMLATVTSGTTTGFAHIDAGENSYWLFYTGTDESSDRDFAIKNGRTNQYLTHNGTESEEPVNWYLLANDVNDSGLCLSKNATLQDNGCLDANRQGTGCGWYKPKKGDWDGTCWTLTQITFDEAFKSEKKALVESISWYLGLTQEQASAAATTIDSATDPGTAMGAFAPLLAAKTVTVQNDAYFYIQNKSHVNSYICATNTGLKMTNTKSSACIWQAKATEDGRFHLYSPMAKQYAGTGPVDNAACWSYGVEKFCAEIAPGYYGTQGVGYVAMNDVNSVRDGSQCMNSRDANDANVGTWSADAGSHWRLIKATDEEISEMNNAIKSSTDLQTAAANLAKTREVAANTEVVAWAKAYNVGEGLHKYTSPDGAYTTTLSAAEVVTNESEASAAASAAAELHSAVKALTYNLPARNAFYYIKGGATSYYMQASTSTGQAPTSQNKSKENIVYVAEDGTFIFFTTGQGLKDTHSVCEVGGTMNKFTFSAPALKENRHKYLITSNFSGSKVVYDDPNHKLNRNSIENNTNCAWTLESVPQLPLTVTAAGYATLWAPVALTVPAGENAPVVFTAALSADKAQMVLTPLEGNTIPAATPVVVKAAASTLYFPIAAEAEAEAAAAAESALTGQAATVTTASAMGKTVYTLQKPNESAVGFYTYTGTNLLGFRASYQADADAAAINGFALTEGEATGIDRVVINTAATPVYDLSGRRVSAPVKGGLYIVGGRKMLF